MKEKQWSKSSNVILTYAGAAWLFKHAFVSFLIFYRDELSQEIVFTKHDMNGLITPRSVATVFISLKMIKMN